MAKKLKGQGVDRIMKKLQANIEHGEFYEAHQMYRTLYFRYLSQKKYEDLFSLLYDGAVQLLSYNQYNSGTDLAILLVNVLGESQEAVSNEHIDKLGDLFGMMLPDSPERTSYLTCALRWSSKSPDGCDYPFGHPRLHQCVALKLWKEKNYQQSRYHFIRSTDGDGCATMLVEYHITKGYPSEVDLFIAQTVLQYLCLKNKTTASMAFHIYTEKHPAVTTGFPFLLPLLNFLEYLLQAIEREKLAYFRTLCDEYQPSINRDPTYSEYVEKIGQLFFGLAPAPKQHGGLFGNLLQSLLEGFEDNLSGDSEPVAGTSRQLTYRDELD